VSDDPGLANARIAGPDGVERSMVHVASDWPGRFPNVGATHRALASAGADVNARMSPRPQDPNCVEAPAGTGPPAATTSVLAESLRADLLLIDEPAGRKRAQERGLAARGTLGVLVEARKWGVHPSLKPVLDALTAEGFRIAPALVRDALAYVGERHHRRMLHHRITCDRTVQRCITLGGDEGQAVGYDPLG
jgi:hypothetical protein